MKVGLLCGREYSFPPAFLDRVNDARARRTASPREFVKLTGTKMGEPSGYRVIVDRISHEVEYLPRLPEARGARGHLRHQQPVLVDRRRQVLQLLGGAEARRRRAEDGRAAAEGLSGGHRPDRRVAAQPRLSDRLGRPARLRRPSGDSEAVLGRRLEARLQGERSRRSCSRPTTAPRRTA